MDVQNEMKPYVIGLDLGGTNSVFGIVDSRGDIKVTTAIKTQAYDDVNDYVKAAVEALQIIIDQVGGIGKIKAMGIGAPNGNYYNGTIEFAPNLKWGRTGVVPLAKLFSDALGIPVALTNDANAAAIGEMTYGVARGMKNFIVITLGTGVGSGIVVNGQLVYGCDGFAGELGHTIVRLDGRPCGCGRRGCLETYCSATGVARSAREFSWRHAMMNRCCVSSIPKISLLSMWLLPLARVTSWLRRFSTSPVKFLVRLVPTLLHSLLLRLSSSSVVLPRLAPC